MVRQRHYWVVSPNVQHDGKKGWMNLILTKKVAIMGWRPNDYGKGHGYGRGPRFAGEGDPSVQQDDVVLIARGHKPVKLVAVGVVGNEYWTDTFPDLRTEPVQLRRLTHFKPLVDVRLPNIPLNEVLPWQSALEEIDGETPAGRAVIKWLEQALPHGGRKAAGTPRQTDISHRLAVEEAAQNEVLEYYDCQGYRVKVVARDNIGWDLEATKNREKLRIEVKGLSGTSSVAELTPNEYKAMTLRKASYRLCIVTSALDDTAYKIYEFHWESQGWVDQNKNPLTVEEKLGARVSSEQ